MKRIVAIILVSLFYVAWVLPVSPSSPRVKGIDPVLGIAAAGYALYATTGRAYVTEITSEEIQWDWELSAFGVLTTSWNLWALSWPWIWFRLSRRRKRLGLILSLGLFGGTLFSLYELLDYTPSGSGYWCWCMGGMGIVGLGIVGMGTTKTKVTKK